MSSQEFVSPAITPWKESSASKQDLTVKQYLAEGYDFQWQDQRDGDICMSRRRGGSIRMVHIHSDGSVN